MMFVAIIGQGMSVVLFPNGLSIHAAYFTKHYNTKLLHFQYMLGEKY